MATNRTCSIPECSRVHVARGWCSLHYDRWRTTGSPKPDVPATAERRPPEGWPVDVMYWRKVDVRADDECWPWMSGVDGYGYGCMNRRDSGTRLAHRISFELAYGPIPPGMFVCHHCDNPPCQNPKHLFLGTPADNSADMCRKLRSIHGERNPGVKLAPGDIAVIRSRYQQGGISQRLLAAEFGVSRAQIGKIVRRERWRHL